MLVFTSHIPFLYHWIFIWLALIIVRHTQSEVERFSFCPTYLSSDLQTLLTSRGKQFLKNVHVTLGDIANLMKSFEKTFWWAVFFKSRANLTFSVKFSHIKTSSFLVHFWFICTFCCISEDFPTFLRDYFIRKHKITLN